MTLEDMIARRDALLAARWRGVRTVEIEGRRITYATDAEMASALGDLERRIAEAQAGARRRIVRTTASKGL
ncbi:MAG: phage head-tail joining protein [Allosphingosinicella sp.]|uniref:phage head-tail joining protein n=1 Tax=Allosphingosinicella sp. TaxID=2823234 RepID=UPI003921615C